MDQIAEDTKKRKFGEEDFEEVEGERVVSSSSSALSLSKDEMKSLLEPLSKEQLVSLLADA